MISDRNVIENNIENDLCAKTRSLSCDLKEKRLTKKRSRVLQGALIPVKWVSSGNVDR